MTIDDLKAFYGTGYRFESRTRMSANSFRKWCKRGFIPIMSQIKIETLTNGALKAKLEDAIKHVD